MLTVQLLLSILFVAGCYGGVPEGYILEISHDCGEVATDAKADAFGASVTIKSDLHVKAQLKCNNSVVFLMPPINDSVIQSTSNVYYTGDQNGTVATDCFFFRPNNGSNVYTVALEVFWGFNNGTLMNEYQKYTITCTVDEHGSEVLAPKIVADEFIPITEGLEDNLGTAFSDTATVELVDILGRPITSNKIQMGKKVQLKVSISGGSQQGLTPYRCEAHNSDSSESYVILNAGCGDGVIFPKTVGFNTVGTSSLSPYFKAFQLLEAIGNNVLLSYSCSFSACATKCDGTSCAIKRARRSVDGGERKMMMVKTKTYLLEMLDKRMEESERELHRLLFEDRMKVSAVIISVVGVIVILSLILSLRKCHSRRMNSVHGHPYQREEQSYGDLYPTKIASLSDKPSFVDLCLRSPIQPASEEPCFTEISSHNAPCSCPTRKQSECGYPCSPSQSELESADIRIKSA